MKNKAVVIILYIVLGIPVPISAVSWVGSLISLANIEMMGSGLVSALAIITMILTGTYVITYIVSLCATVKRQKLNFMPVVHMAAIILFMFLWGWSEKL